ncbi:MAG TPA: DNA-processing protein DprA [Prolixibacteraceae bacterium]|nr:DNA-processing protein DprA [Prolixibacteraceae bacterium]HPS12004.1 DNA-processing protein DprA [Prolixibacteraceae bacterium]
MLTSGLTYKIALSLFPRVGAVNSRRLVAYLGTLNAVFEASPKMLKEIPGIGEGLIKTIVENREEVLKRAEKECDFIRKYNLKTFFYLDKEYPRRLAQCDDAPVILFQKGEVDLNYPKVISIVGTRSATDYGRQKVEELISGLAEANIQVLIVSGLAFGIDATAHKTALKHQLPTLGVVGHGLDKMYPSAHTNLAREMVLEGGGVISDFPSETKIDPGNFPRRNRIIAGLSDCTIVVESGEKGGALVTADIANSYNRDVFAFPGRTNDIYSKGCNDLIKKNKAALIESASDLIEFMGWETNSLPRQQVLLIDLNDEERKIIELLKSDEIITTDIASQELGMNVQTINAMMLNLEFKGVLKSLPGNRFKLV